MFYFRFYIRFNGSCKKNDRWREKTDNVWVDFACHNDDFEYKVECIVKYILYNEGWIFENYEILNSNYTALTKPTTETVIDDFFNIELQKVEEWEQFEQGLEETSQIINPNEYKFIGYSQEKISEYFTWDIINYINYVFTPEEGWVGEKYHVDKQENWNWNTFLGKWSINSAQDIDKIEIKSIDSQSITVDWDNEKWDGNIETFTESFNMKYVTGTTEIGADYPDDMPVYNVWLNFEEASMGEGIYFTPYGIYEFVRVDNGMYIGGFNIDGTHFSNQCTKIS